MKSERGFLNYSREKTFSDHCVQSYNQKTEMNSCHCNGKENQPISGTASTTGHSSNRSGLSNPNSPTVHGLIQLTGKTVNSSNTNNFNVKVCNCRDTMSCDHQEVSILTDDRESFGKNYHLQSNPYKGNTCTCSHIRTSSSGVTISNCNTCYCINNSSKASGSLQCESIDITRNDDTPTDSNHRWKLATVNPQEATLVDMGVSMLSCVSLNSAPCSTNMDSLQSSNTTIPSGCCDGSLIKEANMTSPDFFVYKRRRVETPTSPNPFEFLHHEAVLHIFRWLPKPALVKCAQVCKRFHRLALDCSLWRRLDLNCRSLRPGVLGRIVLRGCQYLRLSKAELAGAVFSPGLQHLPPFHASLLYLDLSMAVIQPDTVAELLSACSRLKKVSLEFLTVNDNVIRALTLSQSLDTLNMAMCSGVPSGPLGELCIQARQLKHLNVAWAGLHKRSLDYLVGVLPTSLERLNLAGCRHYLTDGHVDKITHRLVNLVELDLSDCTELTALSIQAIVSLPRLSSLGLSRCYSIHAESFLELRKIKTLKQLSMFGVAEEVGLRGSLAEALEELYINTQPFSTVARPTVGVRRTSIWTARVRDC